MPSSLQTQENYVSDPFSFLISRNYCNLSASFIQQCKLKYPEVNLCLKKAIEDVKPRLPKGIPEMHIPQLEPVHITETTLSSGDFQATFKNVVINRASNFTVSNIDFDVEHNKASLQVHFPVIEFASDYNVAGKVLVLQLNGSGKSHGNASNEPKKSFYVPVASSILFCHQVRLKVQHT